MTPRRKPPPLLIPQAKVQATYLLDPRLNEEVRILAEAMGVNLSDLAAVAWRAYLDKPAIRRSLDAAKGDAAALRARLVENGITIRDHPLHLRGRKRGTPEKAPAPPHPIDKIPHDLLFDLVWEAKPDTPERFKNLWPAYAARFREMNDIDQDRPIPDEEARIISHEILYGIDRQAALWLEVAMDREEEDLESRES